MSSQEYTDFGFKKVLKQNKQGLVKEVFDSVATKYDLMNDLMSLGTHRLWKKQLLAMLLKTGHTELVDVGGGTADIALGFIKGGRSKAYVIDINDNMLKAGEEKVKASGYFKSFVFLNGNAEELPIENEFTNLYSTSFCLRNVSNLEKALSEAYRVLKSGGQFFCLEFSKVNNSCFKSIYDVWSFDIIPNIGKCVAKDKASYEYLVQSIRNFKSQDEFASLITQAGFVNVSYKNLCNGVVAIHTGHKL